MIEELIKLLRKIEGDLEDVLADLHHLRAYTETKAGDGVSLDVNYVLEVLDRIIEKVGC